MLRKTTILGSAILVTTLAVVPIVAGGPSLTSADPAVHPVARIRPVASVIRKKRPTLVASTVTPSKQTLLPAVAQTDITPHHQKLADAVLRALPSGCRDHLKNFYVQYSNVKNRGLGGKTTIIIAGNVSDEEYVGLLIHECGHVIHANLQGSKASGESSFKDGNNPFYSDSPLLSFFTISWSAENVLNASASKNDFVSGYAKGDAFEDFSETFAMYVLHRDALELRAQSNTAIAAKLQWMKTHLPLASNTLGISQYSWEKVVPWDVTKLPVTLTTAR